MTELIDIDPRNLSRIEVGSSFVKADTIEKLLAALNVTIEDLFTNEHIKTVDELLSDIDNYVITVKNNPEKLELIHKVIRDIIFD